MEWASRDLDRKSAAAQGAGEGAACAAGLGAGGEAGGDEPVLKRRRSEGATGPPFSPSPSSATATPHLLHLRHLPPPPPPISIPDSPTPPFPTPLFPAISLDQFHSVGWAYDLVVIRGARVCQCWMLVHCAGADAGEASQGSSSSDMCSPQVVEGVSSSLPPSPPRPSPPGHRAVAPCPPCSCPLSRAHRTVGAAPSLSCPKRPALHPSSRVPSSPRWPE